MDERLLTAIIVVLGVPAVLVGYILGTEWVLRLVPEKWKPRLRPWLWLFPALALLFIFLVYPTLDTFLRSLHDRRSEEFVGLANYEWFLTNNETLASIRNNVLWLIFFTGLTVGFGLLIAILFDRVRYESAAKTVIFIPMAISFVAAGVIWRFMYAWEVPGRAQTGTINALITGLGGNPIDFPRDQTNLLGFIPDLGGAFDTLTHFGLNNLALIIVGAWMWTGFCMVILSAGLKGISTELLEAARVDGANEWQVFRNIILPLLAPTMAVVATTMVIFALKTFDVIYVMTSGNYDTQVIALTMYEQMFNFTDFGRASAVAVVLLIAIIPMMLFNIKRFREQEAIR